MGNKGFRSGFLTAVFMFVGIAAVVLVGRNMLPSVGEAFVLESVSDFSENVSQDVGSSANENASASTSSASSAVPVSSSTVISSSAPASEVSAPSESDSDNSGNPAETQSTYSSESSVTSEPPVSAQESTSQTSEPVSSTTESVPALININTASAHELQRLYGIGEVKAGAIIDYREQNGGFSSVDELVNVKGIGEKTMEKIRAYITV